MAYGQLGSDKKDWIVIGTVAGGLYITGIGAAVALRVTPGTGAGAVATAVGLFIPVIIGGGVAWICRKAHLY